MKTVYNARGGATAAVLSRMEPWEANLVLTLRLWCDGSSGEAQVWNEFHKALPRSSAQAACHSFEALLSTLIDHAHRPPVRHTVGCSCVGSDESVFVRPIKTASDRHLNDAALIAILIAGSARAEHIAVLAGEVGTYVRQIYSAKTEPPEDEAPDVCLIH